MKIPMSMLIISSALLSVGCASKTEREFLGGLSVHRNGAFSL